jgi:subtilase family serine protease
VHEITGDKIYYKIKNDGSIASSASTSALYLYPCVMPCLPVATDSVASLAAGESRTEKFSAYNYTGFGLSVGVKADYNGAINESDEGNNSLTKPKADL